MKNLLTLITILFVPLMSSANSPADHTPIFSLIRYMDLASVTSSVIEHHAANEELYNMAVEEYNQYKWSAARIKFNQYITDTHLAESDYVYASVLLIKSKLNSADYISAIRSIDYLLHCVKMSEKLKHDLEWDKAICYLAVNKVKAQKLFSNIKSDDGSSMQKEACAMVDLLR